MDVTEAETLHGKVQLRQKEHRLRVLNLAIKYRNRKVRVLFNFLLLFFSIPNEETFYFLPKKRDIWFLKRKIKNKNKKVPYKIKWLLLSLVLYDDPSILLK